MTDRWTVRVHQSHTNGAKNPKRRWVVDPPGFDHTNRTGGDHRWHVAGGKWFQWDEINITKREAWEQAMDYADRMARTIEVTLPRDCRNIPLPPAFRHERPIELAWYEDSLMVDFTALGTCETIFIHRDEIKPLALALLAHNHKNQDTQ